jgi:predicted GNAT superfamily acetyltransferase
MKVLFVGAFYADIYDAALERGFIKQGCEVERFETLKFFNKSLNAEGLIKREISWIKKLRGLQHKFLID